VLLVLAAGGWVILLLAAPSLPATLAAGVYVIGAHICHQLPDRSFHIGTAQLPVCARCMGIYGGVALAAVSGVARSGGFRPAHLSARALLALGATPTVVTVFAEWLGMWHPSNVVRALAGLTLGAAVGLILADAAATLHYERCARRRPARLTPPPTRI
jgi:uncharacterized membrane protein